MDHHAISSYTSIASLPTSQRYYQPETQPHHVTWLVPSAPGSSWCPVCQVQPLFYCACAEHTHSCSNSALIPIISSWWSALLSLLHVPYIPLHWSRPQKSDTLRTLPYSSERPGIRHCQRPHAPQAIKYERPYVV